MSKLIKAVLLISVALLGTHYFLAWDYWSDLPMR